MRLFTVAASSTHITIVMRLEKRPLSDAKAGTSSSPLPGGFEGQILGRSARAQSRRIPCPKNGRYSETPAGSYSVWSCTLTTRNGLDISAGQWNTSPIYGKVRSAVGLKSLSVAMVGKLFRLRETGCCGVDCVGDQSDAKFVPQQRYATRQYDSTLTRSKRVAPACINWVPPASRQCRKGGRSRRRPRRIYLFPNARKVKSLLSGES
jgi:hypothetical protein